MINWLICRTCGNFRLSNLNTWKIQKNLTITLGRKEQTNMGSKTGKLTKPKLSVTDNQINQEVQPSEIHREH